MTDLRRAYTNIQSIPFRIRDILTAAIFLYSSLALTAENPNVTPNSPFRVATFNASLHRDTPNGLLQALQQGTLVNNPDPQIANVATIIRKVRPAVILLNEFDYRANSESIIQFKQRYLEMETRPTDQQHFDPVYFPYHFSAPSNTGIPSGVDFNNDLVADGPEDVFGYGSFPGQYGMVLLSQFPIVENQVRTFQKFLWRNMPHARLPTTSNKTDKQNSYYSEKALSVFRLSSKSHWDIPIDINGTTVHLLASHPTPPVFDGPEDRNGQRNHDEIRFWADYIDASKGQYLYDDNGVKGALQDQRRFIILGDLNASPFEGDSTDNPINLLLQHRAVNNDFTPTSKGAIENKPNSKFSPSHTTDWSLRVDYVLPSRLGLRILDGAVFWPSTSEPGYELVKNRETNSDHRLVWLDLDLTNNSP